MIHRPVQINKFNFNIQYKHPEDPECVVGEFQASYDEKRIATLRVAGTHRKNVAEIFSNECALRMGLPHIDCAIAKFPERILRDVGYFNLTTFKGATDTKQKEGVIKDRYPIDDVLREITLADVEQEYRNIYNMETFDGTVCALRDKFGEKIANTFIEQQLFRITVGNSNTNLLELFNVAVRTNGMLQTFPVIDGCNALANGQIHENDYIKYSSNRYVNYANFPAMRQYEDELMQQPHALLADENAKQSSQQDILEHIAQTYPEQSQKYFEKLQKIDEEDMAYICDIMTSNGTLGLGEGEFIQDFMFFRMNTVAHTLAQNLGYCSCEETAVEQ